MKPILCVLCALCVMPLHAGDKIARDANGNVIQREQSTATGVIVRDGNGAITGRKTIQTNGDGSKTIIVRDTNGVIICRESVK